MHIEKCDFQDDYQHTLLYAHINIIRFAHWVEQTHSHTRMHTHKQNRLVRKHNHFTMIEMWVWNVKVWNTYQNLRWLEITNYRIMTERFIELNVWTCTHLISFAFGTRARRVSECVCECNVCTFHCVILAVVLVLFSFVFVVVMLHELSNTCMGISRTKSDEVINSFFYFSLSWIHNKYNFNTKKRHTMRSKKDCIVNMYSMCVCIRVVQRNLIGINGVEAERKNGVIHEKLKHTKWNVLI